VTGGYVYRGHLAPKFVAWYVFGDFESRRIWAVRQEDRVMVQVIELGRAPLCVRGQSIWAKVSLMTFSEIH
jgi:hypothetical protein